VRPVDYILKDFSQALGQDRAVKLLKAVARDNDKKSGCLRYNSMYFTGPSGIGKTAFARLLCSSLYDSEGYFQVAGDHETFQRLSGIMDAGVLEVHPAAVQGFTGADYERVVHDTRKFYVFSYGSDELVPEELRTRCILHVPFYRLDTRYIYELVDRAAILNNVDMEPNERVVVAHRADGIPGLALHYLGQLGVQPDSGFLEPAFVAVDAFFQRCCAQGISKDLVQEIRGLRDQPPAFLGLDLDSYFTWLFENYWTRGQETWLSKLSTPVVNSLFEAYITYRSLVSKEPGSMFLLILKLGALLSSRGGVGSQASTQGGQRA